ncbi:SDR family NAD(P)-dependent oxidoreductase [Actinomycetota bacterium Odt1-20B]
MPPHGAGGAARLRCGVARGGQPGPLPGVVGWPVVGGYNASKWVLEGLSESLAQEVARLGIKVTLVEPGAYDVVREGLAAFMSTLDLGDPAAAGAALLKVVDSDNPPLRVFFGTQGNELLPQIYADRLKTWADWEDVSAQAQG